MFFPVIAYPSCDEVGRHEPAFTVSNHYRTIKELVIETCVAEGRFPSSEKLTSFAYKEIVQVAKEDLRIKGSDG